MAADAGLANLLLLALPLMLLLFVLWMQRRRSREMAAVQASLTVGDEVLTTSGIFAVLRSLDEDVATLEIADGLLVRFDRRAIMRRVDPNAAGDKSPHLGG